AHRPHRRPVPAGRTRRLERDGERGDDEADLPGHRAPDEGHAAPLPPAPHMSDASSMFEGAGQLVSQKTATASAATTRRPTWSLGLLIRDKPRWCSINLPPRSLNKCSPKPQGEMMTIYA
ncbi:hypothetical protein THAOC_32509, partial [Thalassiosira oceanica]